MRLARLLGLYAGGALKILTPGSWKFKYANKDYEWNTNIPENWGLGYGRVNPTIDTDGNHVFKTPGTGSYVAAAHSNTAIDISKYSKIRIRYAKWINASSGSGLASIELLPDNFNNYVPFRGNDIAITHEDDNGPGEFVYAIPDAAKNTNPIRRLWVKAIRLSSTPDANIVISNITFES